MNINHGHEKYIFVIKKEECSLPGTDQHAFQTRSFILSLVFKNCAEIYKSGERKDGVYTIKPDNLPAFDVTKQQPERVDSVPEETDRFSGFLRLNGVIIKLVSVI